MVDFNCKADRGFYEAYKSVKRGLLGKMIDKLCYAIVFYFLAARMAASQDPIENDFTEVYLAWHVYEVFFLVFVVRIYLGLNNPTLYLRLAEKADRVVGRPTSLQAPSIEDLTCHEVFSSVTSLRADDLTQQDIKSLRKPIERQILSLMNSSVSWVRFFNRLDWLFTFCLLFFNIYVLLTYQMSWGQYFLTGAIVFAGLVKHKAFILGIIFFIIIVICIIFAFIASFCFGIKFGGKSIKVPSKTANSQDVELVGGQCAICHLSINVGSNIYKLPCAQSHIFHTVCLNQWTKIKSTCPTCRAQIPVNSITANFEGADDIDNI